MYTIYEKILSSDCFLEMLKTMNRSSLAARPIDRRSLPEVLRDALQERILAGEFADDETLVQETIAAEYGVSRIPVREALRQLEACGLVSIATHRGAVVTAIPTEEIAELFGLRASLEGELLGLAVDRLTDRDIQEAGAILGELEAAYAAGDMASWGRLNWRFHRRLYAPSGRVRTLAILDEINIQLERYVRLHLLVTGNLDEAEREHRELLRRCALHDVAGAVDYLRRHILETQASLLAALRAQRAPQIVSK
jgi:DNA-binding GntR family transcriptional regulator